MQLYTRSAAVAVLVLVLAPAATAQQLSPQDREKLVQYLTTTRDQVLAESAEL
jgi:hypothetical protein